MTALGTGKYLVAFSILLAVSACSRESYLGEEHSHSITFASENAYLTKADGQGGADLLGKEFMVHGTKAVETVTQTVFDRYTVKWMGNAGGTVSNSDGWEYVGSTKGQDIKMWDYSASQYSFVAFSRGSASIEEIPYPAEMDLSKVGTGNPVYAVDGEASMLAQTYASDFALVDKERYGSSVMMHFRKVSANVRIAVYETIPHFSVKDVRFYESASGETPIDEVVLYADESVFPSGKGTMEVSFPDTADQSPVVQFHGETSSSMVFDRLECTVAEIAELDRSAVYLYRSSTTPSYAGGYVRTLPAIGNLPLHVRMDYTLVPTDGTNDSIVIRNATAILPAQFARWQPNYSYTYFLKLTDSGVEPVVFEAVKITAADGAQETLPISKEL